MRVVRADDPVPRLPVSAANAQLGASLASPGGGLSKIASDTLKFSLTHYEHAGLYLSVDPINGSLKPQSAPTDQEEAAVLKDRLDATLKAITAGKEAKAAFDTQESGRHAPLAYMCPIFMSK